MIGKLNHVGVATPSIDASVKMYREMLGATSFSEKFVMEEQGVWVQFVNLPNSQIELIEPWGEKSSHRHHRRPRRYGGQGRGGAQ
jgi:methylmalonyl-CoA/ethylmalonyl-CoA epimerase